MQEISKFLVDNWKIILEVVLLVFSIFLLIAKKKPVKVIDSIKTTILSLLPLFINEAEIFFGAGHGKEKKQFVFDCFIDVFKTTNPDLDLSPYFVFISENIEAILNTPEKKGEKDG